MDGGQVSSGIRLQRVGERRGVRKSRPPIGPFSATLVRIAYASAVLLMKIVPHSREQARWVYNSRPFRSQKEDSGLCEVSPWRFCFWVEQATSAVRSEEHTSE